MIKTKKQLISRIAIDPKKLGGKPLIHGTRISVEQVLRMLSSGIPHEQILLDFPQLKEEDLLAAMQYATQLVEDFQVIQKNISVKSGPVPPRL